MQPATPTDRTREPSLTNLPAPIRLVLDEQLARAALAEQVREQVRGIWIALQRPPSHLPLNQSQN